MHFIESLHKNPLKATPVIIACHRDDELLGAGGLINKYEKTNIRPIIIYVTEHKKTRTRRALKKGSNQFCVLENAYSISLGFAEEKLYGDNFPKLISKLEEVFNKVRPDVIFTNGWDYNQDHRYVSDACDIVMRLWSHRCTHVRYEIPGVSDYSYTKFVPNLYLRLSESLVIQKAEMFSYCYPSQETTYRTQRHIKDTAYKRGGEINETAAEAFELKKGVIF